MSECEQSIETCLFRDPRNDWERKELKVIKEVYKYIFKDQRSISAFTRFIYFYREEIGKRNLLKLEFGREA